MPTAQQPAKASGRIRAIDRMASRQAPSYEILISAIRPSFEDAVIDASRILLAEARVISRRCGEIRMPKHLLDDRHSAWVFLQNDLRDEGAYQVGGNVEPKLLVAK